MTTNELLLHVQVHLVHPQNNLVEWLILWVILTSHRCKDSLSHAILGFFVRVFMDEINI